MVDLSGPPILDLVDAETREWMAGLARRRDYKDGEIVHLRGDPDTTMDIVIRGRIKLLRVRPDGSQSLVSSIGPGQHAADMLMLERLPISHTAVAVGRTTIDHYDQAAFARLLERNEVLQALYRTSAKRLGATIGMVDDLRTLPREVHLAKLLLTLIARHDTAEEVEVVQEDLGLLLGVSAMTVAKCVAQLKREGLIETGYRRIRVPDRERLEHWLSIREDTLGA